MVVRKSNVNSNVRGAVQQISRTSAERHRQRNTKGQPKISCSSNENNKQ